MEFTSPHKCIKNTSTNGTILTDLLNSSRGPQTPKWTRSSSRTWVGQTIKAKTETKE